MEFAVENYLHMADPLKWRCMLRNISQDGTLELMVLPNEPSRSRMHIELRDVIYMESYAGWQGLSLCVATKDELVNFLSNLGSYLREKLQDEYIVENYRLFVFLTDDKDEYFVARDCVIAKVLP